MSSRNQLLLLSCLIISMGIPIQAAPEKKTKKEQFKDFIENAIPSVLLGVLIGGILYLGFLKQADKLESQHQGHPIRPEDPKTGNPSPITQTAHKDIDPRECGICLESTRATRVVILECGHEFCRPCLNHIVKLGINERNFSGYKCPNCREWWTESDLLKISNEDQLDQIGEIQLSRLDPEPVASSSGDPRSNTQDDASDDWVRRWTQECPGCGVPCIKERGCETVVCTRCRTRFKFTKRPAPKEPLPKGTLYKDSYPHNQRKRGPF